MLDYSTKLMYMTLWMLSGAIATLLGLYLLRLNRQLSSTPKEVQSISPRLNQSTIRATYERLSKDPITIDLPPKTGRRYIVVGGGGFLPGRYYSGSVTRYVTFIFLDFQGGSLFI